MCILVVACDCFTVFIFCAQDYVYSVQRKCASIMQRTKGVVNNWYDLLNCYHVGIN